jgi:hypothetical protein
MAHTVYAEPPQLPSCPFREGRSDGAVGSFKAELLAKCRPKWGIRGCGATELPP